MSSEIALVDVNAELAAGEALDLLHGASLIADQKIYACETAKAADADVVRYLRFLTFLPLAEIADLERQLKEAPHLRACQRALAREVTDLAHSQEVALACEGLGFSNHASAGGKHGSRILGSTGTRFDPRQIRNRSS